MEGLWCGIWVRSRVSIYFIIFLSHFCTKTHSKTISVFRLEVGLKSLKIIVVFHENTSSETGDVCMLTTCKKKKKKVITVGVGCRFCVVHHLQLSIFVAWIVAAAAGLKTPGYDRVRFYRHFNGIHYRSVEIHRCMREMLHSLKTWVRGEKNTGQCLCFWFWFLLFLYQCLYGTNRSDCNDVAAAKQPVWRVYWCLGTWLLVSDKSRLVSMHLGILTYGVAIVTMSLHDISIICTNFYGIIMAVPCDDNFVCVAPLVGM